MKRKRGVFNLNKSQFVIGIALGVLCAVIISVALLVGISGLTMSGKLGMEQNGVAVFVVRFTAILAGVLAGTWWAKGRHLLVSGLTTLLYFLLLVITGIFAYDSEFPSFGLCILSVVLGGGAGVLIRIKVQSSPLVKHRIKK